MLRENESKFQTLRVSVPRQIRENIWKNKKSKEMKLSMENEINIIFGVDPSSGLTMVKEVISTDVSSPLTISVLVRTAILSIWTDWENIY